jgi:hypothetical protein
MTQPSATTPSGSGNSFLDYLNTLSNSSTSNLDPKPKINQQGQIDIFGLGSLSGQEIFMGTQNTPIRDVPSASGDTKREMQRGGGYTGVTGMDTGGGVINQYTTTDDYWKQLLLLQQQDPQAFIALQQGLYDAGYYGNVKPTDVRFGIASQKTKDALFGADGAITHYLEAAQGGATVDNFGDWMQKQVDAAKQDPYSIGNGAGSSGGAMKPVLSNPALIDQQGNAVAQGELGRSLSNTEQNGLIGQVQSDETAASNAGDIYMRSVTPSSVARQYILQNNLPEYAQHQAESYMNAFANMFLSGQNQRANTAVGDAAVPTTTGTAA